MAKTLRLRVIPKFLAAIFSGTGTSVRKDGLATYVDLDYSNFAPLGVFDPTAEKVAVQSTIDGSFGLVTLAQILTASQTEQDIASGATVTVAPADGMIKINKSVGSATTVNLPLSTLKVGPVKIVDWKGDAGTNNITINCTGTDKFNGNQTAWTISGDGGSVVITPLKDGTGYAI